MQISRTAKGARSGEVAVDWMDGVVFRQLEISPNVHRYRFAVE